MYNGTPLFQEQLLYTLCTYLAIKTMLNYSILIKGGVLISRVIFIHPFLVYIAVRTMHSVLIN